MQQIELESVVNIRDLGGTKTEDGRTVVGHRLIRSARLSEMTPEDANVLVERYGLAHVIDLRTDNERLSNPDFVPSGVSYTDASIVHEHLLGVVHESRSYKDYAGGKGLPDIRRVYREIVEEPQTAKWHAVFDEILGADDGAILWHCTGGKDRCGLVSYLVETILGIPEEQRMADYLKTNDDAEPRATLAHDHIVDATGDTALAKKVYEIFVARPEYLEAATKGFSDAYGCPEGFLEQVCGVDAAARAELRARYLR